MAQSLTGMGVAPERGGDLGLGPVGLTRNSCLEDFVTLQPRPLNSRFGRRLLVLFVGCAVVPIALVASISYRHVTRHLQTQSSNRLDHAAEALG